MPHRGIFISQMTQAQRQTAYFDHASTSPARQSVVRAMEPFHREIFANASTTHAQGLEARAALDKARERVACNVGADPCEIIFTSGGTESIILSLIGAAVANRHRGCHILTTAFEHHAVHAVFDFLRQEMGFETGIVGIDGDGMVRLDELEANLRDDTTLVSVMAVNNEIGTIQDIRAVVDMCASRGIIVHSDFAQTFGKMDVDFHEIGVDLAAGSGHKFGGPKGTGSMYVKEGTLITPLCKSSHEFGIRAGTVNVPGVVGLSIAVEDAASEAPEVVRRLAGFRDQLWNHIRTVAPDARINGAIEKTLPSILNVRFPGCNGESMLLMLSKAGIAVTTASACQSENPEPSHVLTAIGIDYLDALSSIRLSMGYSTTQDEIDYFVRVFPEIYERAKGGQNRR